MKRQNLKLTIIFILGIIHSPINQVAAAPILKAAGQWSSTGSMSTARSFHTATRLPNGKVLVTGGEGGGATAELYDPGTATWSNTSSMNTARTEHTATILPNGKVLAAGGYNGSYVTSAELYDPNTATWSNTGSMNITRSQHTATLLPSGKMLVTGGRGNGGVTTELYDPNTGTWSHAVSMITYRESHTATLLPNGKVLVAGGVNGSYVASAEVYDPSTGSWSNTAAMSTARGYHTATMLPNGKVLVAGGWNGNNVASAELYDPSTATWSNTAAMGTAHSLHQATLLSNGKVLVAGGYRGTASAELYDPSTFTWSITGSMNRARDLYTSTLLSNGQVLVTGGKIDGGATAEIYDPGTSYPVYTVTPSAGTGGTISPNTAQSVNQNATASFTVTPNTGYTRNNAVGGTCPAGNWNNNVWTTGAIIADCSVNFSFNPIITAPTVTTNTASNITQTSATLNGTVLSSGDTAYVTFDFGTTTNYGTNSAASPSTVYSASTVAVNANKTGLTCNTTYHYRVQASNSAGTSYGYNQSFTTPACPTYTLIITKQGTGNGTVTSTPAGINCGYTCNADFTINTNITLTATPNTGSAFGGFSGATDCNDGYITMDTGKNCIATFNLQPSNGACGSSNGGTFNTAPTMFLCSRGTASAVTGSGPWHWSCSGTNGGTNASCMANIARYTATASVGTGGKVNPSSVTVNYGSPASFTVTPNNGYTRNNAVTGNCSPGNWNGNIWTTGNITTACNLKFTFTLIIPPVNGVCGSANSNSFNTAPTANLCSTGTATAVTGTGPWNWNCTGSNGGSTASCTANINRYTATATAETGGKVNLSSVTVNYNARASFTITPNTGYTRNTTVAGTCPLGSWNGNVWKTGTIIANCTVKFSFILIPVNAWLNPPSQTIIRNQPFTLDLIVNSNSLKVGSYFFTATLDTTRLLVDTTYQNPTGNCIKGVCPGNDALSNPSALINAAGNKLTLTGSDNTTGVGPGNDLHLLVVHLKTKLLTGTTPVTLTTTALDTPEGGNIGLSARGATVNVSYGLCGDSDGNMRVNIIDALAIARKLVTLPAPPTVDTTLADTNKNGRLDINDALFISRYAVGLVLPPEACNIAQPL